MAMIYDELYNNLKEVEPDILLIEKFWKASHYSETLEKLLSQSKEVDFWSNPNQAAISKELQKIRGLHENYNSIEKQFNEHKEMLHLFKDDETMLASMAQEVQSLIKDIRTFKLTLLLNKEQDLSNCFLSINAGAGGTEAQDWAIMTLRMYIRFCEDNNFSCSTIDYQPGEGAGIKSATLFIKGKHAYGTLKGEHGVHRLVRVSPFDANKRRHTSFCSVMITPEIPDMQFHIDTGDLRIDTYRASGAGGQHVNKTESAVRITHLPTNTVVQCQIERSQTQNKETAMKMLRAKLAQRYQEEHEAKLLGTIEKKKNEWGSQIRSYVLHPYKMVKDHRTDLESMQPEKVLDGDLIPFIERYLLWEHETDFASQQ
jgi:peptide chain release factor 2